MFNLLRWAKDAAATIVVDPWEGSETTYVSMYRPQLDEIAKKLSQLGCIVRTRFRDSPSSRAELYTSDGRVVARVRVSGECCAPNKATIETSIVGRERDLFTRAFQYKGKSLEVEFKNLTASG